MREAKSNQNEEEEAVVRCFATDFLTFSTEFGSKCKKNKNIKQECINTKQINI